MTHTQNKFKRLLLYHLYRHVYYLWKANTPIITMISVTAGKALQMPKMYQYELQLHVSKIKNAKATEATVWRVVAGYMLRYNFFLLFIFRYFYKSIFTSIKYYRNMCHCLSEINSASYSSSIAQTYKYCSSTRKEIEHSV